MKKLVLSAFAIVFTMFMFSFCGGSENIDIEEDISMEEDINIEEDIGMEEDIDIEEDNGMDEDINIEEDIIGVWKIESAELCNLDEFAIEMSIEFGIDDEDMEEFKVEIEEGVSDEFIGETIEFVEDKTVVLNGESGEWTLEEKTFTITKDDESFDFVVESLSGDALDAKFVIPRGDFDIEIAMTLAR